MGIPRLIDGGGANGGFPPNRTSPGSISGRTGRPIISGVSRTQKIQHINDSLRLSGVQILLNNERIDLEPAVAASR